MFQPSWVPAFSRLVRDSAALSAAEGWIPRATYSYPNENYQLPETLQLGQVITPDHPGSPPPTPDPTVAKPFSFLQRPLPYNLTGVCTRKAVPLAIIFTSTMRPTILNSILRHRHHINLRAPARAPTTPAAIARTVSRHDAAAEAAGGSVAQIDDAGQRVGGVDGADSRFPAPGFRAPHAGRRLL